MKIYKIIALCATLTTFTAYQTYTNFFSEISQNMAADIKKLSSVEQLNLILETDDVKALKKFIKENPDFAWTAHYIGLPWSSEQTTPLIAAAWLGAKNCLKYLWQNNIGDIGLSLNAKSSHGYTALHYAQNPPTQHLLKNQTTRRFRSIANTLQAPVA